jgi:thiamine biosynthesis lipoprotein
VTGVVAAVALALAVAGPPSAGDDRTQDYRYLMGTSISVEAFGGTEAVRREAIEGAFAAVTEVDRLMSNYRDDSELALVNRRAAAEPVRVSDAMLAVLRAAAEVSERSGGAFDVTVGPLVRLWGFHDRKPHVPDAVELARVAPLVGYRNVVLDAAAHTVRFRRSGVEIDLGGIAKGFAVELAAGVLRERSLAGFIDAGGNQFVVGQPPGKTSWSVGIKDPGRPERILGVVEVAAGSISTSGQYANSLRVGSRSFGHVLDPRTLQPCDAAESVTVVGPDATLADALSKVGLVLGPARGREVIESFPSMTALVVYRRADGTTAIDVSPGLAGRFHPAASVSR